MSQGLVAFAEAAQHPVLWAFFLPFAGKTVARMYLVRLLRGNAYSEWQQLGSPSPLNLILYPRSGASKGLWEWVWMRKYRHLQDRAISIAAVCHRLLMIGLIPAGSLYLPIIGVTGKLL